MNLKDKMSLASELAILEAELKKRDGYRFKQYFPDAGPLRRELYTKATQFFDAGKKYPQRLILGGNRTGKTEAAAYEITCHMTGLYPHWWTGRRFDHPVEVWAAGDTATTTRDIQQLSLYGPVPAAPRSGLIPAHLIRHSSPKHSIPGAVETIWVRHVSGGESSIQFKSYDQQREAFQGTSKHIIWLDEEPPEDVATESMLRTLTVNGMMVITFTPVEGLTPFLQNWLENSVILRYDDEGHELLSDANAIVFAPDEESDIVDSTSEAPPVDLTRRQKCIVMISWDEVPHLSEAAREQMMNDIPPYQRAARTRGVPYLGSGVIYPIPEEEIREKPFPIPDHWPRGYGMDVGWNWTVAVWGAYDPDTATWHIYKEHFRSHAEPPTHAAAIRATGDFPGRIDPAANGRSQVDGKQLLQMYLDLGLKLDVAPNAVEAGIGEVWNLLSQGRIKVSSALRHWWTEYRMYRRDAKGRPVKKNDHLMDATRYLVHSGIGWLERPGGSGGGQSNLTMGYGSGYGGGSSRSWMG